MITRKPALMILGTGSDVGKSLLVAGLARAYSNRGLAVRPFKPQNMSNNAAVTADGGEIGRAQALQARAARTAPTSDMNPVLLKPQSETGSQVVVQGRIEGYATARDYTNLKPTLMPRVLQSFDRLGVEADLVLVEGAGSPAEVNLRASDIANMGFAEAADVACVLVGDIDRGGVIASIVGTHALLPTAEQRRIRGYIINKFRGDISLFDPALDLMSQRTEWRNFGIVPHFAQARLLPAEDGVVLDRAAAHRVEAQGSLRIVVPRLPGISNFDDLDPLSAEPGVSLILAQPGRPLPNAELILLPGSKTTLGDLAALRREGWDIDIAAHLRQGGRILGICGGYQLLGRRVSDPEGMEGPPSEAAGLGLLDVETILSGSKRLVAIEGVEQQTGMPIHGYEMHLGVTTGADTTRPFLSLQDGTDGAVSPSGAVMGSYFHGLFANDAWRRHFIAKLGGTADKTLDHERLIDQVLDRLAVHCEAHLDLDGLLALARERGS